MKAPGSGTITTATVRLPANYKPEVVTNRLMAAIKRATVEVVVDLDSTDRMEDWLAPLFRRAARIAKEEGLDFVVHGTSPIAKRFLRTHGMRW